MDIQTNKNNKKMVQRLKSVCDLVMYETTQAFKIGKGIKYTFANEREARRIADIWSDSGRFIDIYDIYTRRI